MLKVAFNFILLGIALPIFSYGQGLNTPCSAALSVKIELSRNDQTITAANSKDLEAHLSTSEVPSEFKKINEMASEFGFGPQLKKIVQTNIMFTRDGNEIGYMGLTENKKAIVISPLVVKPTALPFSNEIVEFDPYYLNWQKRLIQNKFMKPGLGWFVSSGKIYLVRELLVGHSIQRFHSAHSEAMDPKLMKKYLASVDYFLSKKTDEDPILGRMFLVPKRSEEMMAQFHSGNLSFNPNTNPVTETAILEFLLQLSWVFKNDGTIQIEGIRNFIKPKSSRTLDDFERWEVENGVTSYQSIPVYQRPVSQAQPIFHYSNWMRFWIGHFAAKADIKIYLAQLLKEDPIAFSQLMYLESHLDFTETPTFFNKLHSDSNSLLIELKGGLEKHLARYQQGLVNIDHEMPYPRPSSLKFANKTKLRNHARHAKEFGLTTADEYVQLANQSILSPSTQGNYRFYFKRPDGDIFVFANDENWIAIFNETGVLKTFYKPDQAHRHVKFNEPINLPDPVVYIREMIKAFDEGN